MAVLVAMSRRIHAQWLIAAGSLGFCVGVIAAPHIAANFGASIVWFLLALSLMVLGGISRKQWAVAPVVAAGLVFGLWHGGVSNDRLTVYQGLIGHNVTVSGVTSEDPDIDKSGHTTVRLEKIVVDGHSLPGRIWVSFGAKYDIERGDSVTTKGRLQAGFAGFSASLYRAEKPKVKRPTPQSPALVFRHWFDDHVRAMIDEPASSLGLGFLLGERRGLPEDLESSLRVAGLMHIVVASGYNLTILVRLARRIFAPISKFQALFAGGLLTTGFITVTGMSPSMSRAGLIAGLSLLAWYWGRRFHPLVLLPFAAAVTLLINPSYGWNDLGWSLSFAAFAGVMIMAPLLHAYFFADKKPGVVRQIAGETIAAQLFTFPLILASFGTFSVVGVLANLLILPLVPLAMLLTFISGVVHAIIPFAAIVFAGPAETLLGYMTWVAQWCAKPAWAQVELAVSWWQVGLIYLAMTAACVWMWRATNYSFRDSSIVD